MFSSSSSLSLTWTARARQINLVSLDDHFLRIITESFGVERDTIQLSRRGVDLVSADGNSIDSIEVIFTFPGGFLHVNQSHLIVRVTNHTITSSSSSSPLTSSFLSHLVQLFAPSYDDQPRYSINDIAGALVFVSFGSLDSDIYMFLSSAFIDGQWFANTVLPRSLTLNRPLTVSGFVSGGFDEASFHSCLSLYEALIFLPSSLDPSAEMLHVSNLVSATDGDLHATVAPSLPFNSEPGQLVGRKTKSSHSITFLEGSFPCDPSGDRFMRLSSTSFAKTHTGSSVYSFLQNYQQQAARVPECVFFEVVIGGNTDVKIPNTNQTMIDSFSIKNVVLQGFGYKICLRHLKQDDAVTPTANSTETALISPTKRVQTSGRIQSTTSQRTTGNKQAFSNLLNQLQNKRSRIITSSATIPEIQVVHVAKSSDSAKVLGLPSAYQEEADVLRRYINHSRPDKSIMMINIQKVIEQWQRWRVNLPRVQPYYAVKCNTDLGLLQTLANLGSNFDCASQGEIDVIMKGLQLSPDRIIYSNPCKQEYGIRHAKQRKVKLTVYDNIDELVKLARIYSDCELLIRISTDDSGSQCPLSCKFGASASSWAALLDKAKELKLTVRGVHFHVGSGCSQLGIFTKALHDARIVFDLGIDRGFSMNILNLGGGFPGVINNSGTINKHVVSFEDLCNEINPLLSSLFPVREGVKVVAEPGRFFAAPSACLAVKIYSRRKPADAKIGSDPIRNFLYYINDGVYGSFNNLIFDHADVTPRVLIHPSSKSVVNDSHLIDSAIFGQTCDGFDCVKRQIQLPQLEIGDWLMFESMGAYTICAASTFNGFELPTKLHVRIMPSTNKPLLSPTGVTSIPVIQNVLSWTPVVCQQQLQLSPTLAGYQLYQQQLLQQYSPTDASYSHELLPSPSSLIDSISTPEFSFDQQPLSSINQQPLSSINEDQYESLLDPLPLQRPRLSFRPLSVRPLQSTAQQHTSYPRLGGGKVHPRLVANLLRSAYCRHRPATLSSLLRSTPEDHYNPVVMHSSSLVSGEVCLVDASTTNKPFTVVPAAC